MAEHEGFAQPAMGLAIVIDVARGKRLEKGRFVWQSAKDGMVSLTSTQLACPLHGSTGVTPRFLASAERRIGRSFSSLPVHIARHSGGFL